MEDNPDEYEKLMQERSVLINAEELKELTYSSYNSLYGMENSIIENKARTDIITHFGSLTGQ